MDTKYEFGIGSLASTTQKTLLPFVSTAKPEPVPKKQLSLLVCSLSSFCFANDLLEFALHITWILCVVVVTHKHNIIPRVDIKTWRASKLGES